MKKEHIIAFRKKHNLTQVELAALLENNGANISAYERGYSAIPLAFVEKFRELSNKKGNYKEEAIKLLPKKEAPKKPGRKPKQISTELLEDTLKGIQEVVQEKAQKQSVPEKEVQEQAQQTDVLVLEPVPDNRPASEHYHAGKVDVWMFADENFDLLERIGFHRINILKYVTRFGKKKGYNHEDLDKAIVEIEKLKQLTKGEIV